MYASPLSFCPLPFFSLRTHPPTYLSPIGCATVNVCRSEGNLKEQFLIHHVGPQGHTQVARPVALEMSHFKALFNLFFYGAEDQTQAFTCQAGAPPGNHLNHLFLIDTPIPKHNTNNLTVTQ